jgi:hypothetical protein
MADTTTIVDTYLAMWNETDAKRRAQLIVCPACSAPLNILGIELRWGIEDLAR